jgi:glycosyltransferase involved in cell wall biosynthesis
LATGKPVVSTALPEICENASGLVYIARDEEDFVRKVEEVVKEAESPNKELVMRRIKFAKENSWEKRIETIEKLLKNIFKSR